MNIEARLQEKREEILATAAKYGAYNVRVFGSVARGEADSESDVDFLVEMEAKRSLLDLGGLLMELQDLLGCRVDVVTEKGLRQRVRERALSEAISL
jgi:predicted nucleotidyltransferase